MVAGDLVDPSLQPQPATSLIAFDAFIHNANRRAENPNVFLGRSEPVAFDHGDAFAFVADPRSTNPCATPVISIVEKHAFASFVRRRAAPDLSEFRARLAALDDVRSSGIADATPPAWQGGMAQGKLQQNPRHPPPAAGCWNQWLPQVEASMQS